MQCRRISVLGRLFHPFEASRVVLSTDDAIKIEHSYVVFSVRISGFSGNEIVFEGATTTSTSAQTIVIGSPQPFVSDYKVKGSSLLQQFEAFLPVAGVGNRKTRSCLSEESSTL